MASNARSSAGSDDAYQRSLINQLPGGRMLLMLPGSGIVVKGESLLRYAVSNGVRWFLGTSGGVEDVDPEEALVNHNYAELRSAVQKLIGVFDTDDTNGTSLNQNESTRDMSDAEFLRAFKIRIEKLESQLKAERQARNRAEKRLLKLESAGQTQRENDMLSEEIAMQIAKLEGVENQLRQERAGLEQVRSRIEIASQHPSLEVVVMRQKHCTDTNDINSLIGDSEALRAGLMQELDTQRELRMKEEQRVARLNELLEQLVHERNGRQAAEAELQRLRGEITTGQNRPQNLIR